MGLSHDEGHISKISAAHTPTNQSWMDGWGSRLCFKCVWEGGSVSQRDTVMERVRLCLQALGSGSRILIRAGERRLYIWEIWEMPKPLTKRKLLKLLWGLIFTVSYPTFRQLQRLCKFLRSLKWLPGRQWDDTLCTDVYYNTENRGDFTRDMGHKD